MLAQRVAPIQQTFYFTNKSQAKSGRYLWFYCSYPPSGDASYGRLLGVIDIEEQRIRVFPETQFSEASPMVDAESGWVYWVSQNCIWTRGPSAQDETVKVSEFPGELIKARRPERISTHLTRSADGKYVSIDATIGRTFYIGAAPLDGGKIEIWQEFNSHCNHAQFSPTDPAVQLLARDWWIDIVDGAASWSDVKPPDNHIWLIEKGKEARPLFPGINRNHTHAWWDADGVHVWYVDYTKGVEKANIHTGIKETVWPNGNNAGVSPWDPSTQDRAPGVCHAHCDTQSRYLVGDISPYQWERGCRIAFYNIGTGKEVNIVSDLPLAALTGHPRGIYERYHIDPHPQFCTGDEYISYTTTVPGYVTVAFSPVKELAQRTEM